MAKSLSIGETIQIIFVRLERAAEEKRKQARKIEQKAKGSSKKKSTKDGGRLAHQKSIGSKEK